MDEKNTIDLESVLESTHISNFDTYCKTNKESMVLDEKAFSEYFKELFRVSKNQIICGGNYFNLPPCRCFVVWDKRQPWKNFSACEYLWTSFKAPAKLFSHLFIQKRIHPTQKPVALYEYLIKTFAKQGDKILDTHLGSGSSRIAAYNLGFDFVGCEINKEFYDKQQERFINECQ